MNWKPIETAPQEEEILVFVGSKGFFCVAYDEELSKWEIHNGARYVDFPLEPILWAELPKKAELTAAEVSK